MMTEDGPYGPHLEATDEATSTLVNVFRERNFTPAGESFFPCTQSPRLSDDLAIFAFFDMPRLEGPMALEVKLANDIGGLATFLITEPRQELPCS